jgi:hypothetical protein
MSRRNKIPLFDLLRIEKDTGQFEILMKSCTREQASDLEDCISDFPDYLLVVTEHGRYQPGDIYPVSPAMEEPR